MAVLETLYRQTIDPGFGAKAKHAVALVFPGDADYYIDQCFNRTDKETRLYVIRNSINHGDIDIENPTEQLRIGSRHHVLKLLILQFIGRFIRYPFPAPHIKPK